MTNQQLFARRENAVARAAMSIHPIFAHRAQGVHVQDADGQEYLDFTSGIAVMNVGHSHPKVVAAAKEQIDALQHLCFAVSMNESYVALAEKLIDISPGADDKRVFLANSGAEAVENAVKIARAATGRQAVVAFTHAFHGRTHLALSLTAKADPFKVGFAPRAAEIYRCPYPYTYRNPWGARDDEQCGRLALELVCEQVETTIGPNEVAAFIIEPIAGEGGFIPAPLVFLRGLSDYAREIGALFIADEIQSGVGRSGAWWAVDHAQVEPDLLLSAKALASGFPLSAVVGRRELMDRLKPGALGTTFGGNPVSCAAALATLEVIEEERLIERAQAVGSRLLAGLRQLAAQRTDVGDVRGKGAMVALEFATGPDKVPNPAAAASVVAKARELGLLLLPAGTYGNVIRLLPPLRISGEELDRGLDLLAQAISAVPDREQVAI